MEEVVGDFSTMVGWKPDWKGSWRLFVSRWDCNCVATTLYSIFEMKGRLEMGR